MFSLSSAWTAISNFSLTPLAGAVAIGLLVLALSAIHFAATMVQGAASLRLRHQLGIARAQRVRAYDTRRPYPRDIDNPTMPVIADSTPNTPGAAPGSRLQRRLQFV